jgi:hypothetical protein
MRSVKPSNRVQWSATPAGIDRSHTALFAQKKIQNYLKSFARLYGVGHVTRVFYARSRRDGLLLLLLLILLIKRPSTDGSTKYNNGSETGKGKGDIEVFDSDRV